jgi:hypothetical protein
MYASDSLKDMKATELTLFSNLSPECSYKEGLKKKGVIVSKGIFRSHSVRIIRGGDSLILSVQHYTSER